MDDVKILYEDKHLIVVVKPAGMPSQEERSQTMDMVSWLKNYLVREGKVSGQPYIGVVHRLDRPVGGVMVYAKSKEAAARLSAQVQDRQMTKEYLAVLTGLPGKKSGTLTDYLAADPGTNRTIVTDAKTKGAKKAQLEYKILHSRYSGGQQTVLAQIRLITGRHHQIRVQMAHAGAGLWGDTKYNPDFVGREGWYDLALFSNHLSFIHPFTKKQMDFQAEPGHEITDHL